jgi:hypothetical protein
MTANGLRVGDVALCCACGKAILLTRCYLLAFFNSSVTYNFPNPFAAFVLAPVILLLP